MKYCAGIFEGRRWQVRREDGKKTIDDSNGMVSSLVQTGRKTENGQDMKNNHWKWLVLLLTVFLMGTMAGCANKSDRDSGSAETLSAEAEDHPTSRYATLMGVQSFIDTFKARGKMTDHSGSTGSTDEDAPVSLLLRSVDEEANVFYYLDVTRQVDLEDLKKDRFIHDFVKGLNKSSDEYHYSKMELLDCGANYYKFKVSIKNKDTGEELSAEEETENAKGKNESPSASATKPEDATDSKDTGKSPDSSSDMTEAPEETEETAVVKEDEKPMVFIFVEKGKKTYEIIGLDMEAEDASAFTDSFQEILDEIVRVKEIDEEAS